MMKTGGKESKLANQKVQNYGSCAILRQPSVNTSIELPEISLDVSLVGAGKKTFERGEKNILPR